MEFLKSEITFYLSAFACFTALAFIAKGRLAFQWSAALRNSAVVNFLFIFFNMTMGMLVFITVMSVENLYSYLGLPMIPPSFWEGWPLTAKALIFLLVYDFNVYWVHRWLHMTKWAWPTHAVHHSDTQMHFLSWSRSHFIELMILFGLLAFMGRWLGLTLTEIGVFASLRALHQYYVHAHLNWNHGFLSKVLVSPNYHRWHHADVEEAYDTNFASIFPFYDIMFGTHYNPGPANDVPTGFDTNPGDDFFKLVLYPFREWRDMFVSRIRRDSSEPPKTA